MADEGIEIPEDLKYFPYRATFDFECYFKRETEHPRNTAKLTWEADTYVGNTVPSMRLPIGLVRQWFRPNFTRKFATVLF